MGNAGLGRNSGGFRKKIKTKTFNMTTIGKLLSERKQAFTLIYLILLLNPCFYFWADNIFLKDKCMAWLTCLIVATAFCCMDLFLKKKGEKIFLSSLFVLSLVPNVIVWSYLFISNLCMRRDMFWVIFSTHTTETQEYFEQFVSWQIVLAVILYIAAGIFLILKTASKSSLSPKNHRVLFTGSILIVLTSMIPQYLVQAIPVFDFYKSRIVYGQKSRIFQQEREMRKNLKMDVVCTLPDSLNHTFIVILGESTTTCHLSLYGYFRETTPLMDALQDELAVYTDVVTPDTHTIGVLQKTLTFANHEHPEYYTQKPSVVELFNAAGFETYWISNQALSDKWGGSYGVIAEESKHLYDLSIYKQPDGIVLPCLDKILHDNMQGNKIIFIHLMGNHHAYNCRYPKEYEYFDNTKTNDLNTTYRDDYMKQTIDEYDNSVRYGDFVYASVLEQLKKTDTSSYLLFFSDHGEEVFDDSRNARGHFMTNVYPCQCQIPFIFWQSDIYKEEMPEIVIDTARPYSIENLIYSLSSLSGLQYKDYNPEESIFSAGYKNPEKRLVGKEDYDREVLHKIQ
jgi:heptose-I-phosphate ethanolaminephosphotransferase